MLVGRDWAARVSLSIACLLVFACARSARAPQDTARPTLTADRTTSADLVTASPDSTGGTSAPILSAPDIDSNRSDIVFEMKDRYPLGELVEIRIRNQSATAYSYYYYHRYFPACYNLKFFDASQDRRRYPREASGQEPVYLLPGQFIVPEGTHCDLIDEMPLRPGEMVTLLSWNQGICVKDDFGCLDSVRVAPGEYRLVGEFAQSPGVILTGRSREGAKIAVVERKFVIEPARR